MKSCLKNWKCIKANNNVDVRALLGLAILGAAQKESNVGVLISW